MATATAAEFPPPLGSGAVATGAAPPAAGAATAAPPPPCCAAAAAAAAWRAWAMAACWAAIWRWRSSSARIIWRELALDVLQDGGPLRQQPLDPLLVLARLLDDAASTFFSSMQQLRPQRLEAGLVLLERLDDARVLLADLVEELDLVGGGADAPAVDDDLGERSARASRRCRGAARPGPSRTP